MIEMALRGRLGEGAMTTWRMLMLKTGASLRSLRRWCAAFVLNALRWLSAVLTVLAVAMPSLLLLDAYGQAGNVAQRLLASSITLAGWLDADHPADTALRVMWCWGWNAGVGRLL